MKKKLLLLLTIFLTANCFSQIVFEQGYYIDNSGQKTNCLIKNYDWKYNPSSFEYKLSENGEIKNTNINLIEEFGINNNIKYIRRTVQIDKSKDDVKYLSYDKNPIWEKEELFLKVLIEGKANLYSYKEGNLTRFFYSIDGSTIEQLVYKRYLNNTANTNSENQFKINANNQYKQQLWNNLRCSTFKINEINNIQYKRTSLIDLFSKYNECNNSDYKKFSKKESRDLFNMTVRPRLNSSSLEIQNTTSTRNIKFENKLSFSAGIEAEFLLAFNKNKWSIFIEPTYQYYESEDTSETSNVSGGLLVTNVDYKSIEIPIGVRHYFYLNSKSKIFVNVAYVLDMNLGSSIEFKRADNSTLNTFDLESRNNLAYGIGYKYRNKYSLEVRAITSREIMGNQLNYSSKYNNLSVIFGYSFL